MLGYFSCCRPNNESKPKITISVDITTANLGFFMKKYKSFLSIAIIIPFYSLNKYTKSFFIFIAFYVINIIFSFLVFLQKQTFWFLPVDLSYKYLEYLSLPQHHHNLIRFLQSSYFRSYHLPQYLF